MVDWPCQARDIYNTLFPNDGTENGILGEDIIVAPGGGDADPNQNAAVVVANKRTLKDILLAFDGYSIAKKNTTMELFKLNNILKKDRQPFAELETEIFKQMQSYDSNCKCDSGKELKYEK